MNCPSRTDNPNGREGWNQSPNLHSGTTREDFNGMANARVLRRIEPGEPVLINSDDEVSGHQRPRKSSATAARVARTLTYQRGDEHHVTPAPPHSEDSSDSTARACFPAVLSRTRKVLVTFGKFVGPGFMVRPPLWAKQMRLSTSALN